MGMKLCFSIIALAFTSVAAAQSTAPGAIATCKADATALEGDIDLARSKGQLLRQRQLAQQLTALQTRCGTLAPEEERAARAERLREEIRQLRLELDRAQEQLRRLRAEEP
ncbi:MAG: DUF1090 family protein [Variovorax sp.]